MKLGIFMMSLHNPACNLTEVIAEDRNAVIRANELDVVVNWCRERVNSTAEHIASSMMYFASAIGQTKNIILLSV